MQQAGEHIIKILEIIIANIPQMIILFSFVFSSIKTMKNKVNNFSKNVLKSETTIKEEVKKHQNNLVGVVNEALNRTKEVISEVKELTNKFTEKIEHLEIKNEQLFRTNKIAFEIISELVSKNPKLIKENISQVIIDKLEFTKKDLEQYPKNLVGDEKKVKQFLKELYLLVGENTFRNIIEQSIKGFDYEGEKREEEKL